VAHEDFLRKRELIERGELQAWTRRGRIPYQYRLARCDTALRVGLRLTGLYDRGVGNALRPEVQHVHFTFANLPDAFDGFTMLHLSDLHIDGHDHLAERLAASLKHLKVDLCVLTGDYRFGISGVCDSVYAPMARVLESIQARHGVLGVLGNHDQVEMVPHFERMGMRMLLNKAIEVRHEVERESLWIVGVDDPHHYGCDDLPGAVQEVPDDAFRVLLVHTPELITDAHAHGIDLYLCGHTHGGQIRFPLLGPLLTMTNCPREYVHGVWAYHSVQGYTNRGAGSSGVPVRFNCPPEIGLITLHQAPKPLQSNTSRGG
jgi:predicted MPP superfamily phosphohydrolase